MKWFLVLYRGLYIIFLWRYWYFSPEARRVFRVLAYIWLAHMLLSQTYQWLRAERAARGKPPLLPDHSTRSDLLSVGIRVTTLSEARKALALMIALCVATVFFLYVPFPRYLGQNL